MYEKNDNIQVENRPFMPKGRKSMVRSEMATMLLEAMNEKSIDAVIGRAPEFYGPGLTQSITNTLIFNRIKYGKRSIVPLKDSDFIMIIWTLDVICAFALLCNT